MQENEVLEKNEKNGVGGDSVHHIPEYIDVSGAVGM